MLRGEKKTLDWRRKLHPGWYNLHVGKPSHEDASRQAPPPEAPSSVFLGRVRLHEGFKPDADETLHQHTVLESVEFDESIPWKGGASGAWRVERRPPLHGLLLSAGGRHRCFHSPESPRPETSPHATRGQSSINTPWMVRAVPRKRREHTGRTTNFPRNLQLKTRPSRRRSRKSRCVGDLAHQPAHTPDKPLSPDKRGQAPLTARQRLTLGRTPERLQRLMRIHLFADDTRGEGTRLPVQGGLFARHHGNYVFIISVLTFRGTPRADVAPLTLVRGRRGIRIAKFPHLYTCDQDELSDVGFHFVPVSQTRIGVTPSTLKFIPTETPHATQHPSPPAVSLAALWADSFRSGDRQSETPLQRTHTIFAKGALEHLAEMEEAGTPHKLMPCPRKKLASFKHSRCQKSWT